MHNAHFRRLFMHTELFINNEWRTASSGSTIDVVNPATEETITAVQAAGEADVAAAVEVSLDRRRGRVRVEHICQAFECGAIQNPANLKAQVARPIIQGLGGALSEEIRFENGRIRNAHFGGYRVPRSKDVPPMELLLLDRPDLPSAGAGETPLVVVAPAIANAAFHATGIRCRSLPLGAPPCRSSARGGGVANGA